MSDTEVVLRDIKPEDNSQLEGIIRAIFHEFELPLTQSTYADEDTSNMFKGYSSDKSHYFVLDKDGKVIGGAGIKSLQGAEAGICELQKMYLLPEYRGYGYGHKLMKACLKKAKDLGYESIYLESASQLKQAIAMYESYGFKYVNTRMGDTGHYACGVWMLKNL